MAHAEMGAQISEELVVGDAEVFGKAGQAEVNILV